MTFELIDEPGKVVEHPSSVAARVESEPRGQKVAMDALILALSALSKRALIALSNCFTGAALISAWLLWKSVLQTPTDLQLVGLAGYAAFILLLEFLRRR